MRIVLTSWGSRGDIQPLAALAVALRAEGAEVTAVVPPDDEFRSLMEGAGADVEPLGPSTREIVTRLRTPSADAAARLATELVDARFEALGRAAAADSAMSRRAADVIVATGLLPAGARDVAELVGARYAVATFHIFGLPSRHYLPAARPGKQSDAAETDNRTLWREDAERVNALYAGPLNRNRAARGLPPVDNVRDFVLGGQILLAADPILAPWADLTDFEITQTGAWILPDARPLPADVEAFLDAGEPPVVVGFGSIPMHATGDLAGIALAAARTVGRRLILSRGWADLASNEAAEAAPGTAEAGAAELSAGTPPPDRLVVGELNHQALFPRVAAVVHHGGAGTTHAAALAGTPQVIVPQIVDQPHWARRVAELGIGAAHDGRIPTVDSLASALRSTLAPDTAARATALAPRFATDGARVAARRLVRR